MNKQIKKPLVPRLRFPEFRGAGEWNNELLKKLYAFKATNSYPRNKLNYKKGTIKNIHYGDIHTKFSTLFNIENESVPFIDESESLEKINSDSYCIEGDIIFADASEDLNDVGKSIEIVYLNGKKLLSGSHTLLARQKNKKLIIRFGGYLFKSNPIRTKIKKEAQGTKVFGISAKRLSNINIFFPGSQEQKKIADCLSSLDELINAHIQKLDALKNHKKGLMQQLFPCEGETTPKLRFPEFRDAGEWDRKPLGKTMTITSCRRVHQSDWTKDGVPFYRAREIVALNNGEPISPLFINEELYKFNISVSGEIKAGDLLVTGVGSIGVPYLVKNEDKFYFKDGNIIWLKNNGLQIKSCFLYFLYKSEYIQKQILTMAGTGTVGTYTIDSAQKTMAAFPKSQVEQKKIADCLSSLDELIAVQTQKIDVLKAHKKGLMQQLFPAMDEVGI